MAVNEIQTWDFADQRDYDVEVKSTETTSVYGSPPAILQKHNHVMRGTAEPETDGREGLKSLNSRLLHTLLHVMAGLSDCHYILGIKPW